MSPTTHLLLATPAPLTIEQQPITAVEGIIPTVHNIVASVNLDCCLDLKTIALHMHNAEYNPKISFTYLSHCEHMCYFVCLSIFLPSCNTTTGVILQHVFWF